MSNIEVGIIRHPTHLLLEGDARRQLELQLLNRTLSRDLKAPGEASPGRVTKKCRRLHRWTVRLFKAKIRHRSPRSFAGKSDHARPVNR